MSNITSNFALFVFSMCIYNALVNELRSFEIMNSEASKIVIKVFGQTVLVRGWVCLSARLACLSVSPVCPTPSVLSTLQPVALG